MTDQDKTSDEPFNEDFCSFLEYHLCAAFKNSADNDTKYLWCDGVNIPSSGTARKHVNDTRTIVTKAWIGLDGNDEYEMTLKFGKKALSKYARGLDIKECLPSDSNTDWITLGSEQKTITLELL
jgi:hypothetical protein